MKWIKIGFDDRVRGTQCNKFECECLGTGICHSLHVGGGSGGGVW